MTTIVSHPPVDLLKRNWRFEIWLDHRATEAEADELMVQVADLVHGKDYEGWDAWVFGVKKEISEP